MPKPVIWKSWVAPVAVPTQTVLEAWAVLLIDSVVLCEDERKPGVRIVGMLQWIDASPSSVTATVGDERVYLWRAAGFGDQGLLLKRYGA
jgi:hypothetical protein